LLLKAWEATREGHDFETWLAASRKLVIHGGGQGRRLPAYAPSGKPLMPLPVFRWSQGQRLDQTLLDLQLPVFERVLAHAGSPSRVLVTSGDVLLGFADRLPPFPQVDVLGLGMWLTPEKAKDFGVFFALRERPGEIAMFLQKPSAGRIRELAAQYFHLVDTGMWLLSARAIRLLLRRSGVEDPASPVAFDQLRPYELYSQFGLALGTQPVLGDSAVNALTCAVVPLPAPEFYHFGTGTQLIESVSALQNRELDEIRLGTSGSRLHPDQYVQNAKLTFPLRREENHHLWVENSHLPASWQLAHHHILTGVPDNSWDVQLEPGVCLDFVPVGESGYCLRFYGIDDTFRGSLDDPATLWLGRPALNWLQARGLSDERAALPEGVDLQAARLFPVLPLEQWTPRLIEWLVAAQPAEARDWSRLWLSAPRLSAQELLSEARLDRLEQQRRANREACLGPLLRNQRWSIFYKLDLEATAALYARTGEELPPLRFQDPDRAQAMDAVREQMFHAAVRRRRGDARWEHHEDLAFDHLRRLIEGEAQWAKVDPHRCLQEDQIVWARSPVRLDLAGGWTDTPPFCLERGGRVVNLAVDLNGQPPIQVFAKLCEQPHLLIRSIDLGVEQRVNSYEELDTFRQPGSSFALAKAGLALAGFLPRFNARGGCPSLAQQLSEFGGGLEISLLAAVPKGSGLGTSSIMAATLLAALSDLAGLGWDRNVVYTRTLALEQMLTTGGGWQDQIGGVLRGIKSIETAPGLSQDPLLRWLPDHLFSADYANRAILLYYTGVTRLAKSILREVVRGVFLNSPTHLRILENIGHNAARAFDAVQRADFEDLACAIDTSWELNQQLDDGTNPPSVQGILDSIQDWLRAAKLLGAGGGGYLLMLAKDETAAGRIRQALTARPPNAKARFVDFSLSSTGLELTRS
jgi:galactokinase/mevalonate kinase-like predicted kinase